MRFLMLNWRDPANPLSGGAERVTLAYLSELAKRGHDVWWFANEFVDSKPGETFEGVKIVRGGGRGTSIFAARRWYRSQPKFDLVMDQHHGIPWFAPWWCGTRVISYVHEVLGPIWTSFYPWPLSTLGRWQESVTHWLYRKTPFWTACESTADGLRQHGVREITILRYGVHTQALEELPPKPLVPPLRLITVSRLAPNKRIHHAVQTVAALKARGVSAHLTIVGGGETRPLIEATITECGVGDSVRLSGPITEAEKDALLSESHFLLHPSQREGWGLNVIEANAMGTPAAVYPVAGLIESTLDNRTGIVARAETPESLAERIMEALARPDEYQLWRRQAWERAKTMQWDHILPLAADWLESVAQGKPHQEGPIPAI